MIIVLSIVVCFVVIEKFSCPELEQMNVSVDTPGIHKIIQEVHTEKSNFIKVSPHPEEIFKTQYFEDHKNGKNRMQQVVDDHFIECLDCTDTDCNQALQYLLEVETYLHKDEPSTLELCIKNQLGTSKQARRLIDIFENGFFHRMKIKVKSHPVIGPIIKKIYYIQYLLDFSTLFSYCYDYGLDIFFCLQFYSMSILETKGSYQPELFNNWQDWFEFYIPLSPFFRIFAFISLSIILLSQTIMFIRAIGCKKLRYVLNKFTLTQNNYDLQVPHGLLSP